MENIIETRDLTKHFGLWKKKVFAVNDLNLKVKSGTVHGFIGPNGAGKSTTIKMLVGAIRPTKGSAKIMGYPAGSISARRLIGYLPEHPRYYHGITAVAYLKYIGSLCGEGRGDIKKRTEELLDWLGLENAAHRDITRFSAGMKQKLGLAQALIHEPDLLILDEPTSNLDPLGRINMLEKIQELVDKRQKTVFISSHILSELEKVVDNVTIVKEGTVVLESDIGGLRKEFSGNHYVLDCSDNDKICAELKKKKYVQKLWTDEEGRTQLVVSKPGLLKSEIVGMLSRSGVVLEEFSELKMSLENIFTRVIGSEEKKKSEEE